MADFFNLDISSLLEEKNYLKRILLDLFDEFGVLGAINQILQRFSDTVAYSLNSNLQQSRRACELEITLNSLSNRFEAAERKWKFLEEVSLRIRNNTISNLVGLQEKLDDLEHEL